MIEISSPKTTEEFEKYFELRYSILRKPWNEPKGSERDDQEDTSFHACAKYNNKIIGACRLQFIDEQTAQIRYMCTENEFQGKGVGKKLVDFVEDYAKSKHVNKIILHARGNAVEFYKKCGYKTVATSYLLFGCIPHFLMEKQLDIFSG
jgi:predicted GNAT family N-acyltransferase